MIYEVPKCFQGVLNFLSSFISLKYELPILTTHKQIEALLTYYILTFLDNSECYQACLVKTWQDLRSVFYFLMFYWCLLYKQEKKISVKQE